MAASRDRARVKLRSTIQAMVVGVPGHWILLRLSHVAIWTSRTGFSRCRRLRAGLRRFGLRSVAMVVSVPGYRVLLRFRQVAHRVFGGRGYSERRACSNAECQYCGNNEHSFHRESSSCFPPKWPLHLATQRVTALCRRIHATCERSQQRVPSWELQGFVSWLQISLAAWHRYTTEGLNGT